MLLAMAPHIDTTSAGTQHDAPLVSLSKLRTSRHGSRVSVNTSLSTRSHQEYLDSLIPPTEEEIRRIGSLQEEKEEQIIRKRISMDNPELSDEERTKAAALIQRNYRGYRVRRQIQGMGIDPSSRWIEALREAQYRQLTAPKRRMSVERKSTETNGVLDELAEVDESKRQAREKWKKVGFIARRAAGDEDSDIESEGDQDLPEDQRAEKRQKKLEEKRKRQKEAKVMDLQYFLEMVDLKHRYGSNLRIYHDEWKKSDTHENFFYWLDEGEGKFLDIQACPRERLDRERVRYLSREERLDYLVKIDKEGRLCWTKNGARIDTTTKYKDSIHGIVPATDSTPAYSAPEAEAAARRESQDGDNSSSSGSDSTSARGDAYATPEIDKAKGMKKVKHMSTATIFNKLLRSSVQKNTWIFVADTNFRLYVGIKQSGAFQHSSFLHGSRIAAAGLIKIKDGQLDKLSPLSGHYRPNTSQFRSFVHSLKDAGCDMSHVSISRSYGVLLGLEAYARTRRRGKKILQALIHGRDKLLSPEELKQRQEREMDRSESISRERRLAEIQKDEDAREDNTANVKLLQRLHIRPTTPKHAANATTKEEGQERPTENGIVASDKTLEDPIAPKQ